MSNLPAGTVTFLLTDIEGSTRLWEEDAIGMAAAVEAHEDAARSIISEFGGHLLLERGEGDSLFAVFASPSGAVQAALALQLRFREPVGGLQLRIRMGLHAGEAQARGSTYFGRSVNRAARIRSVAKGGQIVLSNAVREIAEAGLPSEIVLRDCGRHRLRDLLRSEQLFEVVHPELPKVTGPLLSLEMHPHNLPVQLTSFVGRQEPLRDLVAMVREHRLVTILGAGGCGKTRLSMQIGAEVLDAFEDGVWLVEAAPIRDEAALMDEILRVLQVDLRSGPSTRKALLILDNCEHLREAAARCTRTLIEQVTELQILTTSREALGLRGERIYPLRSMLLPTTGCLLEELEDYEASALFLQRAHEREPNLSLTQAEAKAIAEIVRLLDGIPLAIEQAASHIGFLSPRQILARLDEWMAQPMEFVDDPDPRHRTLESAIDWSYHLLSPEEQTLFMRLAIFEGWQLEAAEDVCADESLSGSAVVRLMQKLVAKSLVTVEADHPAGRRYRLLEPIRQYASRRLPIMSEEIVERHYQFFQEWALDLDRQIGSPSQVAALDGMEGDIANIRSALEYGLLRHSHAVLSFANNLRRFWMLRGYTAEGRARLEAALAVCAEDSPLRAQTLNAIGSFSWIQSDLIAAEGAFRQALEALEHHADQSLRTSVLHNLGLCLVERRQWAEAEQAFRNCLSTWEREGSFDQAAQARLSLAWLLIERCQDVEAVIVLKQSIPFLQASGNFAFLALTKARASLAAHLSGNPEAVGLAQDALTICKSLGSKPTACAALFAVGLILLGREDFSNAAFVVSAAEELNAQCNLTFSDRQVRLLGDAWQVLKDQIPESVERIRARAKQSTLENALSRSMAAL